MIRSVFRYLKFFTVTTLAKPERKLLWRDLNSWFFSDSWKEKEIIRDDRIDGLHAAALWLLNNQQFNSDKGFSTFYIVGGHTGSYPETSGYIIDSLFQYADQFRKKEIIPQLIECADWLLSIQKKSGGWQSGYVHENKPEIVFNTGQVIRGLMKAYHVTAEKKYLEACIKAAEWLCEIQEPEGYWEKNAFMGVHRVYDSYVSAPLLQVWKETGTEKFKIAAEKNIKWILKEKIHPNGWPEDCDNTIKHNDRPILHTIAYTIDGIIECGMLLEDKKYPALIKRSADVLLDLFMEKGYLWGRYTKNWTPSEPLICTGGAQMSIVWLKLYALYKDEKYLAAARKMNNLLVYIQSGTLEGRKEINGALQGSFPLWGRYEPFAFPNWATKYLLDALMIETEYRS
ncbi:MAG: terpene cyclase/mutase family protein [Bacteroidia bacterium]|nr:terpene cyclase/mutase family protein [Bacteroidia bacterium]